MALLSPSTAHLSPSTAPSLPFRQVFHFLHEFWETLGYVANTLIFLITGIAISYQWPIDLPWSDFVISIGLYLGGLVIRMIIFSITYVPFKRTPYGWTWKEMLIASWGGLRGAVGAWPTHRTLATFTSARCERLHNRPLRPLRCSRPAFAPPLLAGLALGLLVMFGNHYPATCPVDESTDDWNDFPSIQCSRVKSRILLHTSMMVRAHAHAPPHLACPPLLTARGGGDSRPPFLTAHRPRRHVSGRVHTGHQRLSA